MQCVLYIYIYIYMGGNNIDTGLTVLGDSASRLCDHQSKALSLMIT